MNDAILYSQGAQTVRSVPVDATGSVRVLGSATYSIVDLREPEDGSRREVVASTAATVSAVSTTITAAAGPSSANSRRLALTSATGVRLGGTYLLRDTTSGIEEAITVVRVNGLEVETTRAVMREFASGSAFLGVELEGTFPSDVAGDELRLENGGGPFQVTWVYTVGSQLYVAPRELWLTRYGVAPWVRPDEVFRHFPGFSQIVGSHVDPNEAIAGATDDYVEQLQAAGAWERDPSLFRGSMSSSLYVRKQALHRMLLGSRAEGLQEVAAQFATEAQGHMSNLITGKPPTRSVVVSPTADTATPGGEQLSRGGYFIRG